jgi:hypothetical protein
MLDVILDETKEAMAEKTGIPDKVTRERFHEV